MAPSFMNQEPISETHEPEILKSYEYLVYVLCTGSKEGSQRALFSWKTRFEIRPFALLPKNYALLTPVKRYERRN